MELSSVFGGDTLKAADLQGAEPVVVIASVEMKKFDNGNKLVIKFQGKKKALVANKTNSQRIAMAYGTNTDDWVGKEIILFTDMVQFQGGMVEAIRVRAKKPVGRVSVARPDANFDHVPDRVPTPARAPAQIDPDDEIPF